jgi:hypothetical protein
MALSRSDLSYVVIGFRYEKSFRISDISGEICDTILHDKSSPFGIKFFPRLNEIGTQDKTLVNDQTQNYLKITTSDIIFKYNIGSYSDDKTVEIDWFKDSAIPFIKEKLIEDKKIRNIDRIGLMFGNDILLDNLGSLIIQKLTDNEYKEADQFALNFGLKDTAVEGIIKRSVDDYVNRLYLMKQSDSNKYEVIFDYQYYFIPTIPDIKTWNITQFFDRSLIQLDTSFYPFINKFLGVAVEAV